MHVTHRRNGFAALGGLLTLGASVLALAPAAVAAPVIHKCTNRPETLEIESGVGEPPQTFKETFKTISAQGVSCGAADTFLDLVAKNKTPTAPEHYKCTTGHFKVPVGYVPEVCTKPGAKIEFSQRGG
jgi:hypothetical protein